MPLLSKRAKPIVVESRNGVSDSFVRNEARTHKFLTTRRHPIYYMPITKCGSTFLKNLIYVLDHDKPHENPDYIHDHNQDFVRANKTDPDLIRRSKLAFTILRKPSSRFLSLYFDKIYGVGPQNFPEMRLEIAQDCGLDLDPEVTVEGHINNCTRLIDWIEGNLSGDTEIEVNPHWRPQTARVSTVEHLNVRFLTLDGLNWQLPVLLADVVPNLTKKMALARARNITQYPVSPSEVLTHDLECKINEVYADDLAQYQHTKRHWGTRPALSAPALTSKTTLNVLTTHTQNLNLVVMQKAGCTYLRNLTYRLDHGNAHPNPTQIASDDCLAYRLKSKEDMANDVNVIVLRNPYSRFFSLYFDKVWGEGQHSFPWIAKQLVKNRRFKRARVLTQAEHHDNCCRVIGYLQQRFNEREAADLNPHWRPQFVKVNQARNFGFVPILLEDVNEQLIQVADGRIRGLEAALLERNFRNETDKPIAMKDLLSPWIKERLQALYAEDIALYERIKSGWETGEPPEL